VTLANGPSGPDGPNGQKWGVTIYPAGLPAAVWYGSGEKLPQGYARQLDSGGGMRVAGA